jgi:hypothetical protein
LLPTGRCLRTRGRDTCLGIGLQKPASVARHSGAGRFDALRRGIRWPTHSVRESEAAVETRKTFMFTDIVGSTSLAELLGNESWEQLLRLHDDALRALLARNGGEVVEVPTSDPRQVSLKGVTEPVSVALVIWDPSPTVGTSIR